MISKQIFSLDFVFLHSLLEELYRKEEKDKTGCSFNFEHQCIYVRQYFVYVDYNADQKHAIKKKNV